MPSKPPPRNLGQELAGILQQYPELAQSILGVAQNTGGNLALTNANNAAGALLGAPYLRADEVLTNDPWAIANRAQIEANARTEGISPEEWVTRHVNESRARGDAGMQAIFDRYGGTQGGVVEALGDASRQFGDIQSAANTQQRTADIQDVENLGARAVDAFNAANPAAAAARTQLGSALGGLNLGGTAATPVTYNPIGAPGAVTAGQVGAAAPVGPVAPASTVKFFDNPAAGKMDAGGGLLIDAPGWINGQRVAGAPAAPARALGGGGGGGSSSLNPQPSTLNFAPGSALGAVPENVSFFDTQARNLFGGGTLSPIQQALQQQALDELKLGGALGEGDIRTAQQAARAALAAQGFSRGGRAIGAEILNTDALSRQRLAERRNFAGAVDAAGFGQTQANRSAGLAAGQLGLSSRLGYNTLAADTGIRQGQLALGNRSLDASVGAADADRRLQGDMFNVTTGQQSKMFDAGNNLDAARFNATLGLQQQQADRGFALNTAGFMQGSAVDPFQVVLGRSAAPGQAGAALGAASSYTMDPSQFLGPLMGYGGDLANTNYNAQYNDYISAKNRDAALWGSLIEAGGNIGAAVLCHIARSVYGADNPRWLDFQRWLVTRAPLRFLAWYAARGEKMAKVVERDPKLKARVRQWMEERITENEKSAK